MLGWGFWVTPHFSFCGHIRLCVFKIDTAQILLIFSQHRGKCIVKNSFIKYCQIKQCHFVDFDVKTIRKEKSRVHQHILKKIGQLYWKMGWKRWLWVRAMEMTSFCPNSQGALSEFSYHYTQLSPKENEVALWITGNTQNNCKTSHD